MVKEYFSFTNGAIVNLHCLLNSDIIVCTMNTLQLCW